MSQYIRINRGYIEITDYPLSSWSFQDDDLLPVWDAVKEEIIYVADTNHVEEHWFQIIGATPDIDLQGHENNMSDLGGSYTSGINKVGNWYLAEHEIKELKRIKDDPKYFIKQYFDYTEYIDDSIRQLEVIHRLKDMYTVYYNYDRSDADKAGFAFMWYAVHDILFNCDEHDHRVNLLVFETIGMLTYKGVFGVIKEMLSKIPDYLKCFLTEVDDENLILRSEFGVLFITGKHNPVPQTPINTAYIVSVTDNKVSDWLMASNIRKPIFSISCNSCSEFDATFKELNYIKIIAHEN